MQVHIFRGQGRVFGFTEDKAAANLPSPYGPWIHFKTVKMDKGVATPGGVSTDECLDDIERYGYHLTDAHVRITERDLAQGPQRREAPRRDTTDDLTMHPAGDDRK